MNSYLNSADAVAVSFNTALGYPQVSVIVERGPERFMRRFKLVRILPDAEQSFLDHEDYHCPDKYESVPRRVHRLRNASATQLIDRTFSQISSAALQYLRAANPETERELCTAVELSGL